MYFIGLVAMFALALFVIGAYLLAAIIGDWVGKALRRPRVGWGIAAVLAIGIAAASIEAGGGLEAIRCKGPDPRNPCNVEVGGGEWDGH